MNAPTPFPAPQMPADGVSTNARAIEAQRFRSLALNQRTHSHRYRAWAREAAAKGHHGAAAEFTKSGDRYAADALWYWRRSRQPAVQFITEDAS